MSQVGTEQRVGYLVKRAQQALRQACDEELRAVGVSMSQYAVLRALADHPGASSAGLARLCFVTRQSLQDVLRGLRAADLVTVAERAETGRARPVSLTRTGRARLRAAHLVVLAVEERMLAGVDRERLAGLLTRCATNLDDRQVD